MFRCQAAYRWLVAAMRSAALAPMSTPGAWVCPRVMVGMTEASAMRSPRTPANLQFGGDHTGAVGAHPAGAHRVKQAVRLVVERFSRVASLVSDVPMGRAIGPSRPANAGASAILAHIRRPSSIAARSSPPGSDR
jgi:hypothetical protein